MEMEHNMEQAVQDFIGGKRIALVGMSRGGKKFGNMAAKELKERGYQVYPVHPEAEQIDGEKCMRAWLHYQRV